MVVATRLASMLLVTIIVVSEVVSVEFNPDVETYTEEERTNLAPYIANQEYFRQIHSMINAYKADMLSGRMVIETNALIDTKYKTWKRNADLINSILALPKGMNEAGR